MKITGWWFGTMEFYDCPYIGNNHPNWRTHFFQRGWNHQPDKCCLWPLLIGSRPFWPSGFNICRLGCFTNPPISLNLFLRGVENLQSFTGHHPTKNGCLVASRKVDAPSTHRVFVPKMSLHRIMRVMIINYIKMVVITTKASFWINPNHQQLHDLSKKTVVNSHP